MQATIELTALNRSEALRYMGYKSLEINTETKNFLDASEKIIVENAKPKTIWRLFERHNCPLDLFTRAGKDIAIHLANCTHVVFLAATIGAQVDMLIRRLQVSDMSKALFADCLASVAIEQVCDKLEAAIMQEVSKKLGTMYFTSRYSPGYGDFSLSIQGAFLRILDATRKVGISVTDGGLMIPVKSVSAIIGLSDKPLEKKRRNCVSCPRKKTCTYANA
ncbi:MAG TPA: vitamin B12 dependent-methionine synthase activation domain-containing protein [Treponemataceae bacterium]|nr:vitamin B12 dependent-methionine synthase activation domain-containing protein [Treponemataceae bacterium]